jgi:hypothetical protein
MYRQGIWLEEKLEFAMCKSLYTDIAQAQIIIVRKEILEGSVFAEMNLHSGYQAVLAIFTF